MTKNQYSRRLIGLKVLVTGATSGLGFRVAVALAKEGAEVIAIGRNKNNLQDLSDSVEKTKGSITLVCIDLEKQGTIEELSQKILENFGQLNIIIHCAMSSLEMMPINQVSMKEFQLNLLSPITICFRLISCFHEILSRNPKSLFIYISDLRTKKFNGLYNSVKKACDELFLAYKEENERLGVNVLIHYPEAMATKLRKKVLPGDQSIDPDTTNREARKIINLIVNTYPT